MAWLAGGYSKRKPITITGGSSGAFTDFQLKLAVSYEAAMDGEFDDIRFTQADGQTLIDAWAEVIVTDTSATIWVEFPTTPANTVESTYYMYYGNAGAASDWDIGATFIFGDDFEVAGAGDWTTDAGSPDYDSSTQARSPTHSLQLQVGAAWETTHITALHSDNIAVEFWLYLNNNDGRVDLFTHGDGTQRLQLMIGTGSGGTDIYYYDNGFVDTNVNAVLNTWKKVKFYNFDWTAHTVTFEYDGNVVNDVAMDSTYGSYNDDEVKLSVYNASVYYDDFIIRKYAANPPTYEFGSEESLGGSPAGKALNGSLWGPFAGPIV